MKQVGVSVGLKPTTTLHSLLARKRLVPAKKFGIIYHLPCSDHDCKWSYVGESGRSSLERKKEHMKAIRDVDVARSEVARHVFESDHRVDFERMEVIDRERCWRKRIVKEALWTKRHASSYNVKFSISNQWTF